MTAPVAPISAPARPKRRPATLFVTDAELVAELGVPEAQAWAAIRMLDARKDSGFPRKNPLWGDRRYLPAVEAWLLRTNLPTLLRSVEGGKHG